MELEDLRKAIGEYNASNKTEADKERLTVILKEALLTFHSDNVIEEAGQELVVELLNRHWTHTSKGYEKRMIELSKDK